MKRLILTSLLLACGAAFATAFLALDRASARTLTDAKAHSVPTIVALWSTDCPHCKKNLGLFAEMVKADPTLRLITVAVEPLSAEVATSLDRVKVPGKRYVYGADSPEAIAFALDPKWRGELPRTLFFDGRGNRMAVSGVVGIASARQSLGLTDPR
jgi:thiol-disulfide isomerase/thioredoxin